MPYEWIRHTLLPARGLLRYLGICRPGYRAVPKYIAQETCVKSKASNCGMLVQEAILSGEGGALDSKKYKKLDELLNQTDMYTQFLMEHLNDASTATEEVVEAEDGKAGSKRKAGKAGVKSAKRQKPASPTQVRHMSCNKSLRLSVHESQCGIAAYRLAAFCTAPQLRFI